MPSNLVIFVKTFILIKSCDSIQRSCVSIHFMPLKNYVLLV